MNQSFAQFPRALHLRPLQSARRLLLACAFTLAGCATLPPPTNEIEAAQQAVTRASGADADQYAGAGVAQARNELAQAQAAMASGRDDDARMLAVTAAADADLAFATSNAATTRADFAQHAEEIASLQQRLRMPAEAVPPSALDIQAEAPAPTPGVDAAQAALTARLLALES